MEPAFLAWIARTLKRLHDEVGGEWPAFRIGGGPGETDAFGTMATAMLDHARLADTVPETTKTVEGSIVSDRKYRVLVCQAGAAVIWSWLRNRQVDEKLVDHGAGMRSAKTGCLGPCALAPVVQVYPEGTFYGGVDEAGIDRIVNEHVLAGRIVDNLAYIGCPGPSGAAAHRVCHVARSP
jgi:(2Fe-2S) ferredoxin